MDYSKTLNLPKTDFAMKANLAHREPDRLAAWNEMDLYRLLMDRPSPKGPFVLHDGPPYANGDIHMGHALNKTLKDFVVRSHAMMGYRTPYVPGWDCHGMPIENKVREEFLKRKETPSRDEIRKACREYAARWVQVQSAEFQRLGVIGDWPNPYRTMNDHQVAQEIRVFGELADRGFIYRGLKPVMWCTKDETALAEAEIEYAEHTSPSIYVRFALRTDPNGIFTDLAAEQPDTKPYTIIWTTTPWTVPANTAVAVAPDALYAVAQVGDALYLMAEELLEPTMEALGVYQWEILKRVPGKDLLGLEFSHPIFDRTSRLITADYVTMDTGTGVVHTAPGHGREDFESAQRWNLEIINPVGPNGVFTEEGGPFAGMRIEAADKAVRETLESNGSLLAESEYVHSYPHCWRCHTPLVFRTSVQWFMNIDHNGHRERALKHINDVQWVPGESINRISAMVSQRPDWCLSRQRAWGVGIPVFLCTKCDEPLLNSKYINLVADLVEREGSDVWFTRLAEEILPSGTKCQKCGCASFRKETDIFDVWFDSGSTCRTVMEANPELPYPADVYLEGSDQHRGWFNAALMVGEATKDAPPYRAVVTNGFMVDEHGWAMSKSKGTGVSPQVIINKFGADVLRLWVSSTDYTQDARFGPQILDRVADAYRKIRNTFRFLLSNLSDFNYQKDAVAPSALTEIDRWAVNRLTEVLASCKAGYNDYEFTRVYRDVYGFCVTDLSAFYMDALKDRLYAEAPDSAERRSAQTALFHIAKALLTLMAPILVFTADEAWEELRKSDSTLPENVHLAMFVEADELPVAPTSVDWNLVLTIRDDVNKALEEARNNGEINKRTEARIAIPVPGPYEISEDTFTNWQPVLREALNVAQVTSYPGSGEAGVRVGTAEGEKCPRCWLFKSDIGANETHPELCARCASVVKVMDVG